MDSEAELVVVVTVLEIELVIVESIIHLSYKDCPGTTPLLIKFEL